MSISASSPSSQSRSSDVSSQYKFKQVISSSLSSKKCSLALACSSANYSQCISIRIDTVVCVHKIRREKFHGYYYLIDIKSCHYIDGLGRLSREFLLYAIWSLQFFWTTISFPMHFWNDPSETERLCLQLRSVLIRAHLIYIQSINR